MSNVKTVVIGAGVSGLSAAAHLARSGRRVVVLEQGSDIGGVTAGISRDGYTWELGQMLLPDLGPGEPGRRALESLGISSRVELITSCRGNVFPDFEIWKPEGPARPGWRKEQFARLFPADASGLDRY